MLIALFELSILNKDLDHIFFIPSMAVLVILFEFLDRVLKLDGSVRARFEPHSVRSALNLVWTHGNNCTTSAGILPIFAVKKVFLAPVLLI